MHPYLAVYNQNSQSLPKDTRLCTATRVHPLTPCNSKSTSLYSTLLYSTLLYSTLLYSTLLYSTLHSVSLAHNVQSTQILISTALNSNRSAMRLEWQACEAACWCFTDSYSRNFWGTQEHTVRCKVSALAGEGVGDAADRLPPLAQLAHIPDADAVVTAGCGHQMLLTRLNLHHTTQSNTLRR